MNDYHFAFHFYGEDAPLDSGSKDAVGPALYLESKMNPGRLILPFSSGEEQNPRGIYPSMLLVNSFVLKPFLSTSGRLITSNFYSPILTKNRVSSYCLEAEKRFLVPSSLNRITGFIPNSFLAKVESFSTFPKFDLSVDVSSVFEWLDWLVESKTLSNKLLSISKSNKVLREKEEGVVQTKPLDQGAFLDAAPSPIANVEV